ncbi:hypothetical protein AVEN_138640-1 [Araneus ventricosus]|uniref:Uncharacterized protein n=1 Tax=Araneus ventricosus TaxID=182803 RepID=A0A4Y2E6H5_ARAVE|nr:hypothetical protein AVEN_138640-1 [Araneus ventricosus]
MYSPPKPGPPKPGPGPPADIAKGNQYVFFVDNSATIPSDTEKHLLVRARLSNEPADSPGADHPTLRLVLLQYTQFHHGSQFCPEFSLSFDL